MFVSYISNNSSLRQWLVLTAVKSDMYGYWMLDLGVSLPHRKRVLNVFTKTHIGFK
jgi:hypothetical protein